MTDTTTPKYTHLNKWSRPDNYIGETWKNYYSSGVGQPRDNDILERSNFECMLTELGGESETVIVVREGHWAVGWVEWIAIHKDDTKALNIANKIMEALEDYPVINEDHYSELEYEEANRVWKDCYYTQERIEYIRKRRDQFEFHNYKDMLSCVRGNHFAGYACELLY